MSRKTVAGLTADPTVQKIAVELFGKTYFLCFDFNALARTEELTGINMLAAADLRDMTATQFRALLYAALLKYQPEVQLEQVGDLINNDTAEKLGKAVEDAYQASAPEPEDGKQSPNAESPEQN